MYSLRAVHCKNFYIELKSTRVPTRIFFTFFNLTARDIRVERFTDPKREGSPILPYLDVEPRRGYRGTVSTYESK